jgi:hypothetical protein
MPNAEWRCARSIPARWYVRLREDGPWRRVRVVVDLPLVRAVDLRYVGGGYDVLPYERLVYTSPSRQIVAVAA